MVCMCRLFPYHQELFWPGRCPECGCDTKKYINPYWVRPWDPWNDPCKHKEEEEDDWISDGEYEG